LIAHVTDDGEAAAVGLARQKYRQLQAVRRVEWARSGASGRKYACRRSCSTGL